MRSNEYPDVETGRDQYQIENGELDHADLDGGVSTELVRLLIGGFLEGGTIIKSWLGQKDQDKIVSIENGYQKNTLPTSRVQHAAVGLTVLSAKHFRKRVQTALHISEAGSRILFAPAKSIINSRPFRPIRDQLDVLVEKGEAEVEKMVQSGIVEEARSRQLARDTVSTVVEEVVQVLSESPAIQTLIKSQIELLADDLQHTPQIDVLVRVLANNYITYLNDNPEQVRGLIQSEGDGYLEHLSENPEQVQTLVRGQSLSLTGEIQFEIRERLVTSDTALEHIVRSILRRTPRSELPEPAPEVKQRAILGRQEGDFPRLAGDGDGKANSPGSV